MKIILSIAMLFMASTSFAQYETSVDEHNGSKVFKGVITFDDLKNESSFDWFDNVSDNYSPNKRALKYLQENLADYSIVVVMGTWCPDSQNEVPKLYKVLKDINYPQDSITMYGVGRGNDEVREKYDIKLVPTFIVYQNGNEVGRIIERPKRGIENNLMKIIKK